MADKPLRVSEKTHERLTKAQAAAIGARGKAMTLKAWTEEVIEAGLKAVKPKKSRYRR